MNGEVGEGRRERRGMRGEEAERELREGGGGQREAAVRALVRALERRVRGAQLRGMHEFGGAASKVRGVPGAQPPGCGGSGGQRPPGIIYNIYI